MPASPATGIKEAMTKPLSAIVTFATVACAFAGEHASDAHSIKRLFPSRPNGHEWTNTWNNGHPRTFGGATDPDDPEFDTDHGDATYTIDGKGHLTATGDTVRMYVHDPAGEREWGENLEITAYVTRLSETKTLSWSGPQIFARTNHGTLGNEKTNLADDRGYGAKVTLDGRWAFEKETAHGKPKGNPGGASTSPWKELPKDQPIGIKYVLRNCDGGKHVKLELYRDLTAGKDGGDWKKIVEMTDDGASYGKGADACKQGVPPELPLIRDKVLPDSESGKPMLSVYFRHEYGSMRYEKASIREIDPLP